MAKKGARLAASPLGQQGPARHILPAKRRPTLKSRRRRVILPKESFHVSSPQTRNDRGEPGRAEEGIQGPGENQVSGAGCEGWNSGFGARD